MVARRLKNYLDEHHVNYTTIAHPPAYTAPEVAEAAHVPGKELAKSVIVWLDDRMAMAVVPSSDRVNLESLAADVGARDVSLATEDEFKSIFPDCDLGAIPPFGNLWNLPVYASDTLAEDREIAFTTGSHVEVMTLAFKEYERLVQPKIMHFTERATP